MVKFISFLITLVCLTLLFSCITKRFKINKVIMSLWQASKALDVQHGFSFSFENLSWPFKHLTFYKNTQEYSKQRIPITFCRRTEKLKEPSAWSCSNKINDNARELKQFFNSKFLKFQNKRNPDFFTNPNTDIYL